MSKLFIILFIVCPCLCMAQERTRLEGRVTSDSGPVNNVYVINNATGAEEKTNSKGDFTINAKVGDVLVVYSNKTEVRQFVVTETSFKEKPFVVSVILNAVELNEVVVEGETVTSESLGLVPENQKQYTAAEKKLFTAQSTMLDALINVITGRTKMLKAAIETEKKENMVATLNGLFTDDEIMKLNIPRDYVNGFIYYIVEDEALVLAIESNNEKAISFLMHGLATEYIKTVGVPNTKTEQDEANPKK